MFELLKGRKTYIVSILMILYVIIGVIIGKDIDMNLILEALAISGLRAAIK